MAFNFFVSFFIVYLVVVGDLLFNQLFFLLCRLCDSHYVDVFKGSNTNGSPMESLCGYIGGSKVVTLDKGKHLTLEFV